MVRGRRLLGRLSMAKVAVLGAGAWGTAIAAALSGRLEVALWARENGPLVVASRVGGFMDQIEPGTTGFFIDTASPEAMMHTLQHVMNLSQEAHASIRHNAYQRVVQEHDFRRNFPKTLHWLWGEPEAGRIWNLGSPGC